MKHLCVKHQSHPAWARFAPVLLAGTAFWTPIANAARDVQRDASPQATQYVRPSPVAVQEHQVDPHEEMRKLFGRVERRLLEVDDLLHQASSGRVQALREAGPAGLDELLTTSQSRSRDALDSIDRILELAQHEHPGGGA